MCRKNKDSLVPPRSLYSYLIDVVIFVLSWLISINIVSPVFASPRRSISANSSSMCVCIARLSGLAPYCLS